MISERSCLCRSDMGLHLSGTLFSSISAWQAWWSLVLFCTAFTLQASSCWEDQTLLMGALPRGCHVLLESLELLHCSSQLKSGSRVLCHCFQSHAEHFLNCVNKPIFPAVVVEFRAPLANFGNIVMTVGLLTLTGWGWGTWIVANQSGCPLPSSQGLL